MADRLDGAPPTAGPFGEPLFPGAEVDVDLKDDGFVRYRTNATLDEVARFYERAFEGRRWIIGQRVEQRGVPSAVWVPGVKDPEPRWATLLATPIPPKGRRPSAGTHIIVTRRG